MKDQLEQYIDNRKVDIVMSDIAPNFSGDHNIDHLKQVEILFFFHLVEKTILIYVILCEWY